MAIHGQHFTPDLRVEFGGVPAESVIFETAHLVHAAVPRAARSGTITVRNGAGHSGSAQPFQVEAPPAPPPPAAPEITGVNPHQAHPGANVDLLGPGLDAAVGVWFGTQRAPSWRALAGGLQVEVPEGAADGPVSVEMPGGGRIVWAGPFRILEPPPPVIDRFHPRDGRPGTQVTLEGSRFTGAQQVYFSGLPSAAPIVVESDTRVIAVVPDGAHTGQVTLATRHGRATAGFMFTVLPLPPQIAEVVPPTAAEGTLVLIRGRHFGPAAQVAFTGAAPQAVPAGPEGEARIPVPPGARTGPLAVITEGGTAAVPFTVTQVRPPVPVVLDGWYTSQATQRLDRSVPLVARRDAVLRVFLRAAEANAVRPEVRVTLLNGAAPWQRTIPAPEASVPVAFDEMRMAGSWNLAIPGDQIRPGTRVRLEIDPDRHCPGVAGSARHVEAALDVRVVPAVRVTLVPVRQTRTGRTGVVVGPGRTLESWGEFFRKIYPIADLDLQAGAVLDTTADLDDPTGEGPGWFQLMGELEQRRADQWDAGITGRYVYGVVGRAHGDGSLGETPIQSWVSGGADDPGTYRTTFAHEMGHALGLAHAPFNLAAADRMLGLWPEADPRYAQASLGAAGLDAHTMTVMDPGLFKDVMSYAPPDRYWISDFHYKLVLDRLIGYPEPAPPLPEIASVLPAAAGPGAVLRVTGRFLDSAYQASFTHGRDEIPAELTTLDAHHLEVTVPHPAPRNLRLMIRTFGGPVQSAPWNP